MSDNLVAQLYLPDDSNAKVLAAALAEMEDWKVGRRSWQNLGPNAPYTPDVIAAMDAQEVVKLSAYVQAIAAVTGMAHHVIPCRRDWQLAAIILLVFVAIFVLRIAVPR